jgi:hypothetical protein
MGIVLVAHTFGSDLKWHPHIHLIVTGGGLSLDGKHWIRTDPRFLMHEAGLKKRWKYHVTTRMRTAHRQGVWQFPRSTHFLNRYPCFSSLLNRLWGLTWYAHIGASLLDPRFSVRYIGRYTKRAVLAEYRITFYDGRLVRFAFKDYAVGGHTAFATLSPHAFIGRLIRHIPDKRFPMVRHAGLFCNRWRECHLARARKALRLPAPSNAEPPRPPPWAQRQEKLIGKDPLVCPRCHVPLLLVLVAFGPWDGLQQRSPASPSTRRRTSNRPTAAARAASTEEARLESDDNQAYDATSPGAAVPKTAGHGQVRGGAVPVPHANCRLACQFSCRSTIQARSNGSGTPDRSMVHGPLSMVLAAQ